MAIQAAALGAMLAMGMSCEDRHAGSTKADADLAANADVEHAVRSVLDRWVHAFAARDTSAVRSILSTRASFVWLEDGETRYRSSSEIISVLESLPPGMSLATSLDGVSIVAISDCAAWAHFSTKTLIRHGEQVVLDFGGVALMMLEHDQGEWKIAAARSSTDNPRPGREK